MYLMLCVHWKKQQKMMTENNDSCLCFIKLTWLRIFYEYDGGVNMVGIKPVRLPYSNTVHDMVNISIWSSLTAERLNVSRIWLTTQR